VAERLRRELQAAKYGTKAAILQRYSDETGFHPASLRRDVMALDFIDRVEKQHPEFAAELRKLGSTSILELSRLYETDPAGAQEAALAAVSGKETRRQLSARRPKYESELRRGIRKEALRAFESIASRYYLERFGHRASLAGCAEGELETGIHFSRRSTRGSVCFAYCRLKGTKGTLKQFLPYLGLCQLFGELLMAIDLGEVPEDWWRALAEATYPYPKLTLFVREPGGWLVAKSR
jgi:hypothetical protein